MFARFAQNAVRSAMTTPAMPMAMPTMFRAPVNNFMPMNLFTPQPSAMMMMPNFVMPFSPFARGIKTFRTYQPSVKRRKSKHGFLKRMETLGGRKVVVNRRKKGRWQIGI